MDPIGNLGNLYDMSGLLGLEGGHDSTWYKVVHVADRPQPYTDYPSIKDGVEIHWHFEDAIPEPGNPSEYWAHKVKRTRQALHLTVTGNAVSAESALKERGYDAHAIEPTTVMVVLPDTAPQGQN